MKHLSGQTDTSTEPSAHRKALLAGGSLLALALLLYHSLAGGSLLAANPYDSYLLQAQNWLAGRAFIENGEGYPWLELAVYEGNYYLSFPPVPSVLALPFAAAGLSLGNLRQAAFALLLFAGVYLCFWQKGESPAGCSFWAAFVSLGSGVFWLSCSGGVWFQAQLLNLCFAVWGIFFWQRRQYPAAFFLLALAVGCRPFTLILAAGLYLPVLIRALQKKHSGHVDAFGLPFGEAPAPGFEGVLRFTLPPALVAAAMGWYNMIRFGSVFEFGHSWLPEFLREEEGQFSTGYFWQNLKNLLRPVTLNAALDLEFPLFDGFLFLVANPIFLLWCWQMLKAAKEKRFEKQDMLLLAGLVISLCLLCTHRTMGGWQFGARYTLDLLPFALLFFLRRGGQLKYDTFAVWLLGAGILFNLYGAAYLLGR